MYIKPIAYSDESYQKLAASKGNVFNTPKWLAIYNPHNLILHGIYNDNHELIGSFSLYKSSKFGMKYYITPPYSSNNAFLLVNPAQSVSNRITFEKDVHVCINDYIKGLSAKLFISAFPPSVVDTQVYFWNKFKVIPNYTYQLNLAPTAEELFEQLTSEKRKSIRKAEKDNLEIKRVEDYKIVKELVLKTFDRKSKSVSDDFLNKILFEFADKNNSFAFVAYQNGKPSACTFCVYHNNTSYYLFGGYDNSNKHHGAGVSCMWQSILLAKQIGIATFDFEGSMLTEVEKYFREFGGNIVPYYTINKAPFLIECALKLVKRNTF